MAQKFDIYGFTVSDRTVKLKFVNQMKISMTSRIELGSHKIKILSTFSSEQFRGKS